MKLLCIFGKHKPYETTRSVLTGNLKVIEIPTVRCKRCGCFVNRDADIEAGTRAAYSYLIEPNIKTVN